MSRSFGERKVLSSASLRAMTGQVRVILGRNGIGKSTLVKIAVGLLAPDTGMVRVRGTSLLRTSVPEIARRGVFYLPDHDLLLPRFTLREQMDFFSRRFAGRAVDDAASATMVESLLDRRPGGLSGGELRRAELAVAVARNPGCLIADEPYRGIAPVDHDALTAVFRGLASRGCAVVVTGHEVPSLLAASDHVTWCTSGTTYELGHPEAAVRDEAFCREYLGPGPASRA